METHVSPSRMDGSWKHGNRSLSLISFRRNSCCLEPLRNSSTLPKKAVKDSGTPGNSRANRKGERARDNRGRENTRRSEPKKTNHLEATNVHRCLREGIRERRCATVLQTRPGDLQRQLTSISWARGVVVQPQKRETTQWREQRELYRPLASTSKPRAKSTT